MQILIDIDENVFTRLLDNGIEDYAIANDDLFAIAKSIRTGIPLDKIRAEIEASKWTDKDIRIERNALASGLDKALEIIDKYKAESEE